MHTHTGSWTPSIVPDHEKSSFISTLWFYCSHSSPTAHCGLLKNTQLMIWFTDLLRVTKTKFCFVLLFFALKSGIQIIIIRQTRLPKITLQLASLTQAHLYLGVILSPTGHRTGPCWTHSGAEYGYQACLCTLSSPPDMDRAIPRSARQATWTSAAGANCIRGQQQRQAGLTGTPATA